MVTSPLETWRAQFEATGLVRLPGAFAAEAEALRAWVAELEAAPEEPGGLMKYLDEELAAAGRRQVNRIEYLRPFHPGLAGLMGDPRLLRPVEAILGEPPALLKDKINLKLPGGSGFAPHQDAQAGWDRWAPYHVTAVVAIDAADLENGCLEVAPGRHREGLLGERWRPLEGPSLDGLAFEPVPMAPGDALLFDSFLPHRSGPNRSDRPRRILYVTWQGRSHGEVYEAYFAEKRRSFPPDAERPPGAVYRYRV